MFFFKHDCLKLARLHLSVAKVVRSKNNVGEFRRIKLVGRDFRSFKGKEILFLGVKGVYFVSHMSTNLIRHSPAGVNNTLVN